MRGETGFEAFFRRDHRPLVGFVMNLGAQQPTAEDIAQFAFEQAYRKWDVIDHPRAWVRMVASRTYFRDIKKVLWPVDPLEDIDSPSAAFDVAVHVTQCDLVLAALYALPDRQRVVMAWTIDGYPPSRIAEELNVSSDSVRKNLQRARENLKDLLGKDDEGITW
jgi:RNA polymerase sigma factor (sigma-70 family)